MCPLLGWGAPLFNVQQQGNMAWLGLYNDIKGVTKGAQVGVPHSLWVAEVFPKKLVIIFTSRNKIAKGFCLRLMQLSVPKPKVPSPN